MVHQTATHDVMSAINEVPEDGRATDTSPNQAAMSPDLREGHIESVEALPGFQRRGR
jgi:hypothetical protein